MQAMEGQLAAEQQEVAYLREELANCQQGLDSCQAAMPDELLLELRPALDVSSVLLLLWITACALWDWYHQHPQQFPGNRYESILWRTIIVEVVLFVERM